MATGLALKCHFVPRLPKFGLTWFWGLITFFLDLQLKWGLKQSCSPHRELSNGMWHATYTQGIQGDSWLLVVGSQIANLTPSPSFGHNLCFNYRNGSCEPIFKKLIPRAFQWYKELFHPMVFDPYNCSMKIQESIGTPTPKVRAHLGVLRFIPSHSPTFLRAWDVTPELLLSLHLCKPLPWLRAQS